MKHNYKVTATIILLFLAAQFIGLVIVDKLTGEELAFGIERPDLDKETSFIHIFLIIIIVTIVALVIARFKAVRLWKFWFFLSLTLVLTISLSAFFNQYVALFLALLGVYFRIIKPNVIVHNLSELFIYGGLAAIFVPVLSILSISILLVLIAGYDAIAVWKTKHMIRLAKFQSKLKLFAGIMIPYGKKKVAILGGGDIGFPLLFAGVVVRDLGAIGFLVPFVVALSLFLLLYYGDKNKFYPAMPFLTAGCFVGYALVRFLV
ncbi:MAG: presenilin family intramembrane aspartyl protease [Candidatus Woesearchaeota archaeon]